MYVEQSGRQIAERGAVHWQAIGRLNVERMGRVLELSRTNTLGDLNLDIEGHRHLPEGEKRKHISNQVQQERQ